MHHVTFGEKSLLVASETAGLLIRYATLVERSGTAEPIDVPALDPDGNDVVATLVVSPGVDLVSESASTRTPDPDNPEANEELRQRIHRLEHPSDAQPADEGSFAGGEFEFE